MILLTDKAVYSYHNWFTENKMDLRKSCLDDTCENALIIEWFDTVGIYINIQSDFERNFWCRILSDASTVIVGPDFKSRPEAIEDGIKKANKIYNER